MRITESKFRRIMAEEMRHFHEPPGDPRRIAMEKLDQALNRFMDAMSALGIAEEEACEDLANIVKEFCEDKTSSAYEHQMTYGDEEDDDELVDEMYREYVDEFKAIIETGEEPEDSFEFKDAVEAMGEEMARKALDDALAETED